MASTFENIASIMDLLSVAIVVATFLLLYSTQKTFSKGSIKDIAFSVMVASIAFLMLRVVSVVDIQIFSIANNALYRAIFAIIASAALMSFAIKFSDFAKKVGFTARGENRSESDKKIAKALGGK